MSKYDLYCEDCDQKYMSIPTKRDYQIALSYKDTVVKEAKIKHDIVCTPMEHNPETCDECIVARENGDMDKQGY